ncbi:hypothetical protein ACFE04_027505 [Oxalis oulophora]
MHSKGSNKSLHETTMKMAANFIRLSSFSIAKMNLGTLAPSPNTTKSFGDQYSLTIPDSKKINPEGGRRSQEPVSNSKHVSYLMTHLPVDDYSSRVEQAEEETDGIFADYIRKVHEKNRNYPPPPRAIK